MSKPIRDEGNKMSDLNEIENGEDTPPVVYLIMGRAWKEEDGEEEDGVPFHVMVTAPDDDGAVRRAVEALGEQGYADAALDQLGYITEVPEEEFFVQPYKDALAGNVSVITF
ncbi:regulator [Pseudovibrio sp. SCP19]